MPRPERHRAAVDDADVDAVVGDRPGGQLGALHRRRQRAGQRDDDDAGRRPARRGAGRPARTGRAPVPPSTGSVGDAAHRAQNSAVVSSSRSTSSSSPKRIVSGTISMPSRCTTSSGRSQALSVTMPTCPLTSGKLVLSWRLSGDRAVRGDRRGRQARVPPPHRETPVAPGPTRRPRRRGHGGDDAGACTTTRQGPARRRR